MYQQITLIGNLGNDPEMRYTPGGTPVTSFNLAVNKSWTGQDGQRQDKTTWFRITAWRQLAEIASQYLTKGRQVMVVGEMDEAHAYTREGEVRASLEVTAQVIKFLGQNDAQQQRPQQAAAPQRQKVAPQQQPQTEEDIPF